MNGTQILFDRETDESFEYVGIAGSGIATSAEYWQIKRIEKDSEDKPLSVKFADGSADFKFIWNNRTSYNYM